MAEPTANPGNDGTARGLGQRTIDRILGVASVALGIAVLVMTQRLPAVATFRDVGPTFFPSIIGWGFVATGLALLLIPGTGSLQAAVVSRSPDSDDPASAPAARDPEPKAATGARAPFDLRWIRFALAISLTALYVYLLRPVGFVWMTVPYLLAMGLVFGSRNPFSNAVMAFGATAALYLVFRVWLRVPLPL